MLIDSQIAALGIAASGLSCGESSPNAVDEAKIGEESPAATNRHLFNFKTFAFDNCESIFATSMYIQQEIRDHPHAYKELVVNNVDVEPAEWIYEHIRQVCIELNLLLSAVLPVCLPKTCSIMSYGDMEYLCASHGNPKQCTARAYMSHTLDSIIKDLNYLPEFKIRLYMNIKDVKGTVCRIARRLIRIFGHCHFSHKEQFDRINSRVLTCHRFLELCHHYELLDMNAEPTRTLYSELIEGRQENQTEKPEDIVQSPEEKADDRLNLLLGNMIDNIDLSDGGNDFDDD